MTMGPPKAAPPDYLLQAAPKVAPPEVAPPEVAPPKMAPPTTPPPKACRQAPWVGTQPLLQPAPPKAAILEAAPPDTAALTRRLLLEAAAREQAAKGIPSADTVPGWAKPATEPAASVTPGRRVDDPDGGDAYRRSQDRARSRSRSRRDKRGEWDNREWKEWNSRDWSNRDWQNRQSAWDAHIADDDDDDDTEPKEPDRRPWESRDVGLDLQE